MIQYDGLSANTDRHLLSYMLEPFHESLFHLLHVVVPKYKVYPAIQSAQDIIPFFGAAKGEIPKVKHNSVSRNGHVPAPEKFFIHFNNAPKRTIAETKDVLMPEVGIGGKPYLFWIKYALLFHILVLFTQSATWHIV